MPAADSLRPLMHPRYQIDHPDEILSPSLVLFAEILEQNLDTMIRMAGGPERLRPHCKTHKMVEVTRLELEKGITRHKCATLAEAEMLAGAGVRDILLAYNLVGPNIARAVQFVRRYPEVELSVLGDHPAPVAALGRAMAEAGTHVRVLVDIDCGQHRTGLEIGPEAFALYRLLAETTGLRPGGLHVYDGHNHQAPLAERQASVDSHWPRTLAFRDELVAQGWPVSRIVVGGTPSFPAFVSKDDSSIELSPGTCVLHDASYGESFAELEFTPAALLLTRVVSRPTADRVTFDLGYKAVASDPPAGRRVVFPDLPDAEQVLQNEEHLVLKTGQASELEPGDVRLAIPRHVCPTVALHRQVVVVRNGKIEGFWDVVARDRRLTI